MEIILIAAMAVNRVIGKNNDIPWHIPGEQRRFKEITMGHPLIMGRKTYESIGGPLPGRRNVVVTRNKSYLAPGCDVAHSLDMALQKCRDEDKVFIIGGEQLYRLSLGKATSIILTVLDRKIEGDNFFPEFSEEEFAVRHKERIHGSESYTIFFYEKRC